MTSRAETRAAGDIDAGSRDSLEASARVGVAARAVASLACSGAASAATASYRSRATRGTRRRTRAVPRMERTRRWVSRIGGTTELQASVSGFHDWRTRGTDFSADRTNGADASLRLVGRGSWQWSALGYWQWRNLRSSTRGRELQPDDGDARASAGFSAVARASAAAVEVRPPMPDGIELRLGADTRRTTGETRELSNYVAGQPTRRRRRRWRDADQRRVRGSDRRRLASQR